MKSSDKLLRQSGKRLRYSLRNSCLNLILSLEGNPAACWGTWSLAQPNWDRFPQLLSPQKAPEQLCNSTPLPQLALQMSRHTELTGNLGRVLFWEPQKGTENRLRFLFFFLLIFIILDSGSVKRATSRNQVSRQQPELGRKYNTASKETISTTFPFRIFGWISLKAGAERHSSKALTQFSPNLVKKVL